MVLTDLQNSTGKFIAGVRELRMVPGKLLVPPYFPNWRKRMICIIRK